MIRGRPPTQRPMDVVCGSWLAVRKVRNEERLQCRWPPTPLAAGEYDELLKNYEPALEEWTWWNVKMRGKSSKCLESLFFLQETSSQTFPLLFLDFLEQAFVRLEACKKKKSALTASSGEDTEAAEKAQEMLIKRANLRQQQEKMKVGDLEDMDGSECGDESAGEDMFLIHQPASMTSNNANVELTDDDKPLADRTTLSSTGKIRVKDLRTLKPKGSSRPSFSKDLPATVAFQPPSTAPATPKTTLPAKIRAAFTPKNSLKAAAVNPPSTAPAFCQLYATNKNSIRNHFEVPSINSLKYSYAYYFEIYSKN